MQRSIFFVAKSTGSDRKQQVRRSTRCSRLFCHPDLKKAFDRVWHDGLRHALRSFGIEEGLVQIMKSLYSSASSAVLLNNNVSNYFRTTVSVRQGCLLSPILFNLYLENIMRETLHNFKSTISTGGRTISNLRFADDIDLMWGSNDELQELTDRLSNSAREYGMEISSEKSTVMVNSGDNTTVHISMNGQQLEEVMAFNITLELRSQRMDAPLRKSR